MPNVSSPINVPKEVEKYVKTFSVNPDLYITCIRLQMSENVKCFSNRRIQGKSQSFNM